MICHPNPKHTIIKGIWTFTISGMDGGELAASLQVGQHCLSSHDLWGTISHEGKVGVWILTHPLINIKELQCRWESSRVGGKCHFWHFIPTPLSLDCIEPQPLGQSCTTLPTTLLWWAIKVDCQDTAWPSLLSHAKRERNWLPTRSHSRQVYGLLLIS